MSLFQVDFAVGIKDITIRRNLISSHATEHNSVKLQQGCYQKESQHVTPIFHFKSQFAISPVIKLQCITFIEKTLTLRRGSLVRELDTGALIRVWADDFRFGRNWWGLLRGGEPGSTRPRGLFGRGAWGCLSVCRHQPGVRSPRHAGQGRTGVPGLRVARLEVHAGVRGGRTGSAACLSLGGVGPVRGVLGVYIQTVIHADWPWGALRRRPCFFLALASVTGNHLNVKKQFEISIRFCATLIFLFQNTDIIIVFLRKFRVFNGIVFLLLYFLFRKHETHFDQFLFRQFDLLFWTLEIR